MSQGDKVTGTFSLAPNKDNNRDLDIDIKYEYKGAHGARKDAHSYKMC